MPFVPDAPARGFVPDAPDEFSSVPGGKTVPLDTAPEPGMLDSLIAGAPEAALSVATSIPAGIAGNLAGAAESITGGKFGTAAGTQAGAKRAQDVSQALTYTPRGKYGQKAVETLGRGIEASGIGGLNPAVGMAAIPGLPAAGRSARAGAGTVGKALEETAELPAKAAPAAMPGVGAAETAEASMRRERAANLPVPVKLMKGQADRDFETLRFERETAKSGKTGAPLRERYAEQNEAILQNFDAWVDQIGAQAPDLRSTGKSVDAAVVSKAKKAKGDINAAYDKARAAGEMEAPASTAGVLAYLEENASAEGVAKVLPAARAELARLEKIGGKPGQLSINDMERLRQFIGSATTEGTPDMVHAKPLKAAIDAATEGAGGKLYSAARKLRSDYAREFEDHAVVSKLLRTKPGTADRAVAFEDVFSHSVLNGSRDDVGHIRRLLQTAGPEGNAAWKELQGQTVNYLKEQATKGVTTDVKGNQIVSAAGLDKAIRGLDRDGKLELLFGKKGAAQLRDINDLAKDVFTLPPGAVNTSGTASVLLEALSSAALGRLPTAAGKAIGAAKGYFDSRKTRAQVKRSLDGGELPAVPQ